MADESKSGPEGAQGATEGATGTDESKGEEATSQAGPEGSQEDVKDSHGQPGINKERHDREMAAKDAEIAELRAQVAKAAETKEGREELERRIADLEERQAEERTAHKLEMAGCKDVKAAKARLGDFDGDVGRLKSECPYLFDDEKPKGSTGLKPKGAPSGDLDAKLDKAFGL